MSFAFLKGSKVVSYIQDARTADLPRVSGFSLVFVESVLLIFYVICVILFS